MATFARNIKTRFILECLYSGWSPHPGRCQRNKELVSLTKNGWVIDFHTHELNIFRPNRRKTLVKVQTAVYFKVKFDQGEPHSVDILAVGRGNASPVKRFNLKNPGMEQAPDPMPDFAYFKHFAGPITALTNRLQRPPIQRELVAEVYDQVDKQISQKGIIAIYEKGEGYFWQTRFVAGPPHRREYFVIPGVTVRDAMALWEKKQQTKVDTDTNMG